MYNDKLVYEGVIWVFFWVISYKDNEALRTIDQLEQIEHKKLPYIPYPQISMK